MAILFGWESWWASEQDGTPTRLLKYRQEAQDVLHLVPRPLAASLERYVDAGGHMVTTYFSGIVDEDDHVHLGGYPGAQRDLLGIRIEELCPLTKDVTVALDDGGHGTVWTDRIDVTADDVEVLAWSRPATSPVGRRSPDEPSVAVRPATSPRGSAPNSSVRVLLDLLSPTGVRSELPEDLRGRIELVVGRDEASTGFSSTGPMNGSTPQT